MITKLFDERQIDRRVKNLAAEIAKSFPAEFTVVGILKGSFIFVADLLRALNAEDLTPRVEFIRLSSYGTSRIPSQASLVGPAPSGMLGKVLLVDDIADTGWSLQHATRLLQPHALEIRTCTMIDKPSRRETEMDPDYVGFTVEDVFVVGYGLDYAGRYRNLPYVGALRPELYQGEASAIEEAASSRSGSDD